MHKELFDDFENGTFEEMMAAEGNYYKQPLVESTIIEKIFEKLSETITIDGIAFLIAKMDGMGTTVAKMYNKDTGSKLPIFRMEAHSEFRVSGDIDDAFNECDLGSNLTANMLTDIAIAAIQNNGDTASLLYKWMCNNDKSNIMFEIPGFTLEAEQGYYLDDLEDDEYED